jgi:uncharacterized protein (TIGR02453 family)
MDSPFTGFSPGALAFFEELAANNRKAWFEAHRAGYETLLLAPLKALVAALADRVLAIDDDLVTMPAVDRTISRINRDTRFSRDKSPYKTCLWITFKRYRPDWKDNPCFFFEIRADGYRYGMGFYSASRQTMDRLRQFIEARPDLFREAVAWLAAQDRFVVEGESYKRPLHPDLPQDLQDWHRRRNLYLVCNRPPDGRLFSDGIVEDLSTGFAQLAPLYHLLWQLRLAQSYDCQGGGA